MSRSSRRYNNFPKTILVRSVSQTLRYSNGPHVLPHHLGLPHGIFHVRDGWGPMCVGHNSDNTKVKVIVINNNSNQTASTNKHSNPCNSNRGKKVLQESFEIAGSLGFRV